ncbi:hypothetical protein [Rhizobium sp. WW_1]|jgi:hypothetical protein|uniref:hypothetical protein n=1 Tax=Rhizobium sp. WW_1 TaxID=1907375 RepID=UPI00068B386A|nr:hypothetical protein [Rhizobium sp. WW_1]RKD61653.1 hypothetical protein BJ928_107255 [Rhizobium sp. WW_1]
MALPTTFNAGTATIAANDVAVTGQNTTWSTSGIQAGDLFMAAGLTVPIAAVNSNTSLTLADPWPGVARNTASYRIQFTPDATRVLASTRAVLDALTNGVLYAIAGLQTAANKIAYFTGQGTAALADFTGFGRSLVGAADQAAGRTALGLGSAAVMNTGTSGAAVARLDGANIWGQQQAISTGGYAQLVLNAAAGANGSALMGQKNGSPRWLLYLCNPVAEDNTNSGANFELHRYDDAGNWLGSPFAIYRATGITAITTLALTTALSTTYGGTGGNTPASARTGLGLGTAAVKSVGTSGANVPLLSTLNTWGTTQIISPGSWGGLWVDVPGGVGGQVIGQRGGLNRWEIRLPNESPETGSNAGGDFQINRFSDAGAFMDSPLSITRASGIVSFGSGPRLPSFTVSTLPSAAANTQCIVYVSNGTSSKRFAISDGTSWRFPDGAIVS